MTVSGRTVVEQVRGIAQHYRRDERLPQVEIRSSYRSAQGYQAHSHAQLSIGVVEAGATCLDCGGGRWLLRRGDLVAIAPGVVHACNPVAGRPRSYHMIYVDPCWSLARLSALYGRPVRAFDRALGVVSEPALAAAFSALIEGLDAPGAAVSAADLERLLFKTLGRFFAPGLELVAGGEDETDEPLRRRLLDDLQAPPSLERLAAEFGLARETLIHRFKRRYGITPRAFLNNARIEQAKLLLQAGLSIAEAAQAVGFSDQSQFHRAFVRLTASTPRQYQRAKSLSHNNP